MDHVNPVLEGDPDDVVLGEVGRDGCEALADLVRLIGLLVVVVVMQYGGCCRV